MPHPIEVREICIKQHKLGLSTQLIEILTGVPIRTVHRWIAHYNRYGTIYRRSDILGNKSGRPSKITVNDLLILCSLLLQDPTLYLLILILKYHIYMILLLYQLSVYHKFFYKCVLQYIPYQQIYHIVFLTN